MSRHLTSLLGRTALSAALLLGVPLPARSHGGGGHGGGAGASHGGAYHGGAYHGGYYHGGYHPYGYGGYHPYYGHGYYPYHGYGFYRPYYGYGFGGLGLGGLGLGGLGLGGLGLGGLGGYGLGGYGLGGSGLGGYGAYLPLYGAAGYGAGAGYNVPPVAMTAPGGAAPTAPAAGTAPPPDNAAHLQLVVPENALVLFDGERTTQAGPVREFVSPPLTAGRVFTYKVSVRYTDASGQVKEDTRRIHVRANDWFRIDFNQPAPPEPPLAEPLPQP